MFVGLVDCLPGRQDDRSVTGQSQMARDACRVDAKVKVCYGPERKEFTCSAMPKGGLLRMTVARLPA